LGARSMDLVDLEFLELGCLAGKNGVELFLWIWSCVELSQTRPKAPVRAGCPRVPPAGVLAWHGELAPHASGGIRVSGWRHVAWTSSWSETETARANKQVVGGGDLSCEVETCRRSFL
jgi:hypothetical protein